MYCSRPDGENFEKVTGLELPSCRFNYSFFTHSIEKISLELSTRVVHQVRSFPGSPILSSIRGKQATGRIGASSCLDALTCQAGPNPTIPLPTSTTLSRNATNQLASYEDRVYRRMTQTAIESILGLPSAALPLLQPRTVLFRHFPPPVDLHDRRLSKLQSGR